MPNKFDIRSEIWKDLFGTKICINSKIIPTRTKKQNPFKEDLLKKV